MGLPYPPYGETCTPGASWDPVAGFLLPRHGITRLGESMETISGEIFKVLGYLVGAYVLFHVYNIARKDSGVGNFKNVLWKGLLFCAGIALFASFSLGNPTCLDREQDNRSSTCYEYADDGYEPTAEQRAARFAYWFILLYVPVVFGALMGRDDPRKSP